MLKEFLEPFDLYTHPLPDHITALPGLSGLELKDYSRSQLGAHTCLFPGEFLIESWAGCCWLAPFVPYLLLKEYEPIVCSLAVL